MKLESKLVKQTTVAHCASQECVWFKSQGNFYDCRIRPLVIQTGFSLRVNDFSYLHRIGFRRECFTLLNKVGLKKKEKNSMWFFIVLHSIYFLLVEEKPTMTYKGKAVFWEQVVWSILELVEGKIAAYKKKIAFRIYVRMFCTFFSCLCALYVCICTVKLCSWVYKGERK